MRLTHDVRTCERALAFWTDRLLPSAAWGGLAVGNALLTPGAGKAAPVSAFIALAALLTAISFWRQNDLTACHGKRWLHPWRFWTILILIDLSAVASCHWTSPR